MSNHPRSPVTDVKELRAHLKEVGERAKRLRRHILDTDVLRRTLPTLAPAAARRPARVPAMPPVASLDASFGSVHHMSVDGLAWSVPLPQPHDPGALERAIGHQHFPYRAITETRQGGLGGIMLDIGANNGRMAIPRIILGDVQAVFCAEPDPLNYCCLVRNIRDNGLEGIAYAEQVAIGAVEGGVLLRRSTKAGGHQVADRADARTIEVPGRTLDSWIARLGIELADISFIKIDVQGAELDVLRGGVRATAAAHIFWQLEVDPKHLTERGASLEQLSAALAGCFTHFIDVSRQRGGERTEPIAQFRRSMESLLDGGHTDILAFTLAAPVSAPTEFIEV